MKKVALVVLVVLLIRTVFVGCSNNVGNSPTGSSTAKEVTLSMYLIGEPPKDYDIMLEELNKNLKKDINATVVVKWIAMGEYKQKYPLLMGSGESIDLIFSGEWTQYVDQAKKKAFMALDDLLPKYAPKSYSEEPKEALEQARIDGKIYMLPSNYKGLNTLGFTVRGDLRKKYNIGEIKNIDDFSKYLDAIKKNEPDMIPFNAGTADLSKFLQYLRMENSWDSSAMPIDFAYKITDPSFKLFTISETPEYKELVSKMSNWYKNGYWPKDVLANKEDARESFINGKNASALLNLFNFNELFLKINQKNPEWQIEWFSVALEKPKLSAKYIGNGMSIGARSKNPERALMFLELLRNNQNYFDLTTYGIKGRNYDLTQDGKLTLPAGVTAANNGFPPDGACPWGWRQTKFYKTYDNAWPKFDAMTQVISNTCISSKMQTFIFNDETVKSEIASLTNIRQQYEMPLLWGAVEAEQGMNTLKSQREKAGIEKVKTELEKQWNEYSKK